MPARAQRILPLGLVMLLAVAVGGVSAQIVPCEAPAKVREALRTVPAGTASADHAERIEALRALLKRFPADVFVHERYQDAILDSMGSSPADRNDLITEYRALAEKHPRESAYAFLAARAQVGSNTKNVLPQLESLAPAVPPARLDLVRIYRSTAFKDQAKALEHLQAFTAACPSALAAYAYFDSLEPSDFLTQGVARMRKTLERRSDPTSLVSYSTLWSLEFRVKPAADHDALRRQVAQDLKRLRTIDPGNNATYYSMLAEGYKLTDDAEGAKWVVAQQRKLPSRDAVFAVMNATMSEWSKAHPYPKSTDTPETWMMWRDAYAQATARWAAQWPDRTYVCFRRVNALRDADLTSPADVEAAGENLLKAAATNPGEMTFVYDHGGSSFALMVADLYAVKGVRPDRLPDLVKQGLAELDTPPRRLESDLYPRSRAGGSREYIEWYGALTIADVWLNAGDADRARDAIVRVQSLADRSKPENDEKDAAKAASKRKTYLSRQSDYWARMGDLARLDGRKVDAITFYQNALLARAEPPESPRDELAEKARAVWKEIGGSETAWQAWSNRKELLGQPAAANEAASDWAGMEKKLPEFDLTDLSGRRWQLASIKGTVTLINVWAST